MVKMVTTREHSSIDMFFSKTYTEYTVLKRLQYLNKTSIALVLTFKTLHICGEFVPVANH